MKEFISTLNWVDYVIIVAFLRGAFVGYKEGFFAEVLRIVVYGASTIGAVLLAPSLSPTIQSHLSFDGDLALTVSMILISIALFLMLRLVALILLKVIKAGGGFLFNLLGLAVGIGRWAVILSIVFMSVKQANISVLYEDISEKSRFAAPIIPIAPTGYDYLSSVLPSLPAVPAN